jgi:hypothetical protein
VGTLQGTAMGASAGRTVTVDLISMDTFVPGPFTVELQTNFSY